MFLSADLIQRTLIVLIIKAWPKSREKVLTAWSRRIASNVLGIVHVVGGSKVQVRASVPGDAGVLVLMNHQSLLDIPVAFRCIENTYPKIVTRERYRKGYPLVSHMIRLYEHPTVRPGENARGQLRRLKAIASTVDRPLVIYPEGTRTRDGEVQPFKTPGLRVILSARRWSVYLVVADGMWRAAGLGGFVRNLSSIRIRVVSAGPYEFDAAHQDADMFISDMQRRMIDKLAEIRTAAGVA